MLGKRRKTRRDATSATTSVLHVAFDYHGASYDLALGLAPSAFAAGAVITRGDEALLVANHE